MTPLTPYLPSAAVVLFARAFENYVHSMDTPVCGLYVHTGPLVWIRTLLACLTENFTMKSRTRKNRMMSVTKQREQTMATVMVVMRWTHADLLTDRIH
ncbi:hypothetical protein F4777DRAFT_559359 [Nemania sp. FL0916]|nr:hypothetical protein F4777DRAFT_559359 [Nemania sp. FL0916]